MSFGKTGDMIVCVIFWAVVFGALFLIGNVGEVEYSSVNQVPKYYVRCLNVNLTQDEEAKMIDYMSQVQEDQMYWDAIRKEVMRSGRFGY